MALLLKHEADITAQDKVTPGEEGETATEWVEGERWDVEWLAGLGEASDGVEGDKAISWADERVSLRATRFCVNCECVFVDAEYCEKYCEMLCLML